ncbi:hypothetical protein BJ875DRAFT_490517, partial [Amylocarpus encephaloides]
MAGVNQHGSTFSGRNETQSGNIHQGNFLQGDIYQRDVILNIAQSQEPRQDCRLPAIDSIIVDLFLQRLSKYDQKGHKRTIPSLDCDKPEFYWIFRNIDFQDWSASRSPVLWLSGPPKCNLDQISSYIVDSAKNGVPNTERCVLYFFCLAAAKEKSIVSVFVHTLLYQIICCSRGKEALIGESFLDALKGMLEKRDAATQRPHFEGSPETKLERILHVASDHVLWTALEEVLLDEQGRELVVVVDGLDKVRHEKGKFTKAVREFVERLRDGTSKVQVLLTSLPQAEIKEVLGELLCIEYDKERTECLASLRFDNSRYNKISEGYEGSFKWIWRHSQYEQWSASDASRLLYLQGKPGSGKSTLTKYFKDNLQECERGAKSATVAKFFYSDREGELQRDHRNMLRSILYDIIDQIEVFFYDGFQSEYRKCCPAGWDYISLRKALLSIGDYSPEERLKLYLIIDAVDESDDRDRRDILELLLSLCSRTTNCVVKVFIASRPVGFLEHRINETHSFIKLQDETKLDISIFAGSFLKKLDLTDFLDQAIEYIVENAHGVFLWVKLVAEELLAYNEVGCAEKVLLEFLRSLPTELEDFYSRMLTKMKNKPDLPDKVKMFQFVLFACRPLAVSELLHALGIPDNSDTKFTASDESFKRSIPLERYIGLCGGGLLEVRRRGIITSEVDSTNSQTNEAVGSDSVQVMHQTVREFFLRSDGDVSKSEFRMSEKDAHIRISITCLRYLMLCAANTSLAKRLPDIKSWTSELFKDYAQYLDERPFANYALSYLKHHIDGCYSDANVSDISSQFINELIHSPAAYILEGWVSSNLKTPLSSEHGGAAEDFRDKVIHAAVFNGFLTATKVLLTAGANVNAEDEDGSLPLSRAAERGHEAVVQLLLQKGAKVNAQGGYHGNALQAASVRGHEAIVQLLLQNGAEVNAQGGYYGNALRAASYEGHEATVQLLLQNGAEVNAQGGYYGNALRAASYEGHEATVQLLLQNGAEVNAQGGYHGNALQAASVRGHEAIVQLLLQNGAEVNAQGGYHGNALQAAAVKGHKIIVQLLLQKRAEVNAQGGYHGNALQAASVRGHEAIVQLLLQNGAE